MIFNLMKPVPTTESATMYLYGHEADKTVTYNGVELPELPEWDKETYPYAVIVTQTFIYFPYHLIVSTKPMTCDMTNSLVYMSGVDKHSSYSTEAVAWDELESATNDMDDFATSTIVWANHDILNKDGTVYLAASDPVTTYTNADVTINGVGYVGAVLPKLPEWDKTAYPYVAIGQSTSDGDYILYGNSVPTKIQENFLTGDIRWAFDLPDGSTIGFQYDHTDGKWVLWREGDESVGVLLKNVTPVWTNHDIIDLRTDTVYLSATEPIPVYE